MGFNLYTDMNIVKAILKRAKEEYLYTFGAGLVGLYATEDRMIQLLEQAIAMSGDGYRAYREPGFLDGVTPFYMSQTKSYKDKLQGWLDPAYTLSQYAVEYDMTDNLKVCNCISYQMNAASRATRLSMFMVELADKTKADRVVGRGLLYLSAAILQRYADYTILNLDTIRAGIGANEVSFKAWYAHSRGGLLLSENTKHLVPRIDKFVEGTYLMQSTYYQPITNVYQNVKKSEEQKQVRQYAAMLSLLLMAAHADGSSARTDSE